MAKIWILEYRGRFGYGRLFRKESTMLRAIRSDINSKAVIRVFEEVEHYPAGEFKKNFVVQRERDEQLDIILNDDSDAKYLMEIKNKIKEFLNQNPPVKDKYGRLNYYNAAPGCWEAKEILSRFQNDGLSKDTFKLMLGNSYIRAALLYVIGGNTEEWYKLLFRIHNFVKIDPGRYGANLYHGKKLTVTPEMIESFKKAKEGIRKERKELKKVDKKKLETV